MLFRTPCNRPLGGVLVLHATSMANTPGTSGSPLPPHSSLALDNHQMSHAGTSETRHTTSSTSHVLNKGACKWGRSR